MASKSGRALDLKITVSKYPGYTFLDSVIKAGYYPGWSAQCSKLSTYTKFTFFCPWKKDPTLTLTALSHESWVQLSKDWYKARLTCATDTLSLCLRWATRYQLWDIVLPQHILSNFLTHEQIK